MSETVTCPRHVHRTWVQEAERTPHRELEDEGESVYLNDLHTFDTATGAWSMPEARGQLPSQREGHSACVVGSDMILFGGAGLDGDDRSINLCDLHKLDTVTMTWSRLVASGEGPQERRYHTASVVEGRLLVFGGQYYDYDKDLHFECSNAVCEIDLEQLAWRIHPPSSPSPLKRACHAAGVVGKSVYVVGGRYWDEQEDDYIFLNDVQALGTRPNER